MSDSTKQTQPEDHPSSKPIDWTKVLLSIVYFVLFPITLFLILRYIILEYQKNKYAHQEKMALKVVAANIDLDPIEVKRITLKEKDLELKEKELVHKEKERKDKIKGKAIDIIGKIAGWIVKALPFTT